MQILQYVCTGHLICLKLFSDTHSARARGNDVRGLIFCGSFISSQLLMTKAVMSAHKAGESDWSRAKSGFLIGPFKIVQGL